MSFLTSTIRLPQLALTSIRIIRTQRHFYSQTTFRMAANLDAKTISKITEKERSITGSEEPVQGGSTAQAQKNAGQPLNRQTIHDITKGETKITGSDEPLKDGPTATAQSILTKSSQAGTQNSTQTGAQPGRQTNAQAGNQAGNQASTQASETHSGKLDSATISKITSAEKEITGSDQPVPRGPTAQAQKHVGEQIGSDNLHDITEGEKKITGGERIKGGPTSTAQSELSKSQN